MKKKKKKGSAPVKRENTFDKVIFSLADEFSKIPNFDLTHTDPDASLIRDMVIFRISDATSYRDLVCHTFIPATNKAIVISKREVSSSRFKNFPSMMNIDYQETLYDVIRLSYVGLFHKWENFVLDVVKMVGVIQGDEDSSNTPIDDWLKSKPYSFNIRDWQMFPITHKINWICNCVKHRDGYPTKTPKPYEFSDLDESIRIQLSVNDFKEDCNKLIDFYPEFIRIVSTLSMLRTSIKNSEKDLDFDYSEDFKALLERHKAESTARLVEFMDLLRSLKV